MVGWYPIFGGQREAQRVQGGEIQRFSLCPRVIKRRIWDLNGPRPMNRVGEVPPPPKVV